QPQRRDVIPHSGNGRGAIPHPTGICLPAEVSGIAPRPAELFPLTENRTISMTAIKQTLKRLGRDQNGGEVIEYALILGLIVVVAIAIIAGVGTKVVARWTSVDDGM